MSDTARKMFPVETVLALAVAKKGADVKDIAGYITGRSIVCDACAAAVAPALEPGVTTVGTAVNIRHLAATVEGQTITCEAELIEVDRRRLTFSVVVTNDKGVKIGEGTHERFVFVPKK